MKNKQKTLLKPQPGLALSISGLRESISVISSVSRETEFRKTGCQVFLRWFLYIAGYLQEICYELSTHFSGIIILTYTESDNIRGYYA